LILQTLLLVLGKRRFLVDDECCFLLLAELDDLFLIDVRLTLILVTLDVDLHALGVQFSLDLSESFRLFVDMLPQSLLLVSQLVALVDQ
jgi:hypothetical protein